MLKARNELLDLYVRLFGRIPEHDAMLAFEAEPEAAKEAPEQQVHAEVRVETGQAQEEKQAA